MYIKVAETTLILLVDMPRSPYALLTILWLRS